MGAARGLRAHQNVRQGIGAEICGGVVLPFPVEVRYQLFLRLLDHLSRRMHATDGARGLSISPVPVCHSVRSALGTSETQ